MFYLLLFPLQIIKICKYLTIQTSVVDVQCYRIFWFQLTSDLSWLSDDDVHDETLLVALLVHDGDLNGFPGDKLQIITEFEPGRSYQTYSVSSLQKISSPSWAS